MEPAPSSADGHISTKHFLGNTAYLLRETFEGSPEGAPSAYLDRGASVFSTINEMSAVQASREVFGTTTCAQLEHAKFYLDRMCEYLNGSTEQINWEQSWLIETVNDDEWAALREGCRRSYENTLRCLAAIEDWSEDRVGMAMAMVAHTAYHLGAIRQISKNAG